MGLRSLLCNGMGVVTAKKRKIATVVVRANQFNRFLHANAAEGLCLWY